MPSSSREQRKRRNNRIATIAASIFAVVALGLLAAYIAIDPHADDGKSSGVLPSGDQAPAAAFPSSEQTLPPLKAPPGTKTVVIGDSWAMGYSAKPDTDGFIWQTAREFGWDVDMRSVSGTGYMDAGPKNTGTYGNRIKPWQPDPTVGLVIVQGSLNDVSGRFQVYQTAGATLKLLPRRFPNAAIMVVGPGTDVMPVPRETTKVSGDLAAAARENGAYYVTLVNVFTAANFNRLVDSQTRHPNNEGHTELAEYLEGNVREFMASGQAT